MRKLGAQRLARAFIVVTMLLAPLLPRTALAELEEPVLERYVIGHGGDPATTGSSVNAFIHDDQFSNATAQASTFFHTATGNDVLRLKVWRRVASGEIVFALLVSRVEIRGYDQSGKGVYSHDLPDFSFGDSASGNWVRRLRVPKDVHRWEITYVGNYE